MRNFGTMSSLSSVGLSAGARYIEDNKLYYNQFLPRLAKKYRSEGRGSFADVVENYRSYLALTGSESRARTAYAYANKKALPPSSNEFVVAFQDKMSHFGNSDVALDAVVTLAYRAVAGPEAKQYRSGTADWLVGAGEEENLQGEGVSARGKEFVQRHTSAGGTAISSTDDLYDMEETSFFDQYKWPIIGGTAVLLATGAYFFLRK